MRTNPPRVAALRTGSDTPHPHKFNNFVKRVEVGYLVTMQIGDKPSRYVWTTEDVDNGGCVDCPNGTDDCYNTDIEACFVRDELEEYAEKKGYTNVSFGIEEVIL